MTNEFRREVRYVVLKNADIMQCLTINELIELRRIQARVAEHRTAIGKPRLDCVVVEADWPEYEPTWEAIEVRMTGSLKESAVPSVPVDLITDYLVSISAHVAHQEEPQAQAEIRELLRMLADAPCAQPAPSVPDGWPTEEMTTAFARVFNVRDQYGTFPQAFRAALATAPEAKGEFKKRFASPPRSMIEDSVKEAGISDVPFDFQIVSLEDLERFAAIISKHERDACYEIAQSELRNMSALMSNPPKSAAAWEIACRIRARNNL